MTKHLIYWHFSKAGLCLLSSFWNIWDKGIIKHYWKISFTYPVFILWIGVNIHQVRHFLFLLTCKKSSPTSVHKETYNLHDLFPTHSRSVQYKGIYITMPYFIGIIKMKLCFTLGHRHIEWLSVVHLLSKFPTKTNELLYEGLFTVMAYFNVYILIQRNLHIVTLLTWGKKNLHVLAIMSFGSTVLYYWLGKGKIYSLWTQPWSNNPKRTKTQTIHKARFWVVHVSALMVYHCHFIWYKIHLKILSLLPGNKPRMTGWYQYFTTIQWSGFQLFDFSASSAEHYRMCWVLKHFTMAIIKELKHNINILTSLCWQH